MQQESQGLLDLLGRQDRLVLLVLHHLLVQQAQLVIRVQRARLARPQQSLVLPDTQVVAAQRDRRDTQA